MSGDQKVARWDAMWDAGKVPTVMGQGMVAQSALWSGDGSATRWAPLSVLGWVLPSVQALVEESVASELPSGPASKVLWE